MIERRRGACLPAEPFGRGRIIKRVGGEHFESDRSAKAGIFGRVNHAHAA
jgi:hypothetical protein